MHAVVVKKLGGTVEVTNRDGCLNQECRPTISGQVDMQFQICDGYGQGWSQEVWDERGSGGTVCVCG